MSEVKPRLGRGLESLLSARFQDLGSVEAASPNRPTGSQVVAELAIATINANPHQPRQSWDGGRLEELADSIKANGVVQPVIVRQLQDGYQLVAGERRLRAAQMAGLEKIPAIIRDATEEQMLELALVENIHRADLSALERARAYKRYLNTFGLTQEQAATKLGEDRATIANYIRLLDLPEEVQTLLAEGRLTMGHARAILGLPDQRKQREVARRVVNLQLSVRALERLVQQARSGVQATATATAVQEDPYLTALQDELTRSTGTKVTIQARGRKAQRGRIVIDFYSLDDFERIREKLLGSDE